VVTNKQKILKSIFIENFKSRTKIENVLRKYVKGYSRDKIQRIKVSRINSNSFDSYTMDRLDNKFSKDNLEKNLYNKQNQVLNKNNYQNSFNGVYYNTNDSNNLRNLNIHSKSNLSKSKDNELSFHKGITTKGANEKENLNANVFDRLNSSRTVSKRNKMQGSFIFSVHKKDLKDEKELVECTFSPNINHKKPRLLNKKTK